MQLKAPRPVLHKPAAIRFQQVVDKLLSRCDSLKTQLYLTHDGDSLAEEMQELAFMFAVMLSAAQKDLYRGLNHNHAYMTWVRRLDEALLSLVGMTDNYSKWDSKHMTLMDDAMDASILVSRKTTTESLRAGFQETMDMR